jgi:acetyltransferase-like isoleucine patch superfamily enzyme
VDPYAVIGNKNGDPVVIGNGARIGTYALIRGAVRIGENFKLGSYSSVEGFVDIGNDVTIRGKCEIPTSFIGDRVNIYAYTKFYDTPHPPDGKVKAPLIGDDVVLCCDVAVLGGCVVGAGSYICAQTFVTQDIPPYSYVKRDGSVSPRR